MLLRDALGLPPAVVLAVVGGAAHMRLNWLLKNPLMSPWGVLGPLALGVALETWEIWVRYRDIGLFAPGNDPLLEILARHAIDIAVMLAVPVLLVSAGVITSR